MRSEHKHTERLRRLERAHRQAERAESVREFVAEGETQDVRRSRSLRYRAERLRRAYAQLRREQAEQKQRRREQQEEYWEVRQLAPWFRMMLKDPFDFDLENRKGLTTSGGELERQLRTKQSPSASIRGQRIIPVGRLK